MQNRMEYQTVALGALLHDIGKFLMRARDLPFKIEGSHPKVSHDFVNAFADTFQPVADVELLKALVRHHHQDTIKSIVDPRHRQLAYLVNKADGLSASERGQRAETHQDYKTRPLASVFLRVFQDNDPQPPLKNYHPRALTVPKNLTPKDLSAAAIFPDDSFQSYAEGELEKHLESFGNLAKPLLRSLRGEFSCVLSHLLSLLSAYTWCIPADTQEKVPDTSLYDHLQSAAAIAACLYQGYEARNAWQEATVKDAPGQQFYLLVGDVSGIQRFVFDIASVERAGGGVAKRLRARSLYVQLISEVAPLQVLELFGLPLANVIMASGGKFYILLPNLPDTNERLEGVRRNVDNWFLDNLNGALGLNLAGVPFGETELGKGFGEVMKRVMESLEAHKSQTFRSSLAPVGRWRDDAFLRPPFGEDKRDCPSCGKFPASKDPGSLCGHCREDREWGQSLPKANYIDINLRSGAGERELLDASISLSDQLVSSKAQPSLLVQINNPDTKGAVHYPTSFRYLVNYVPTADDKGVLDFHEIARKSQGRHYLGFLKADVDRLGEVLAFGLRGEGKPGSLRWDTISRLDTLSRQLDIFFTGWVEHLLETEFTDCYAVFSGGDDLFLVGPWNRILELGGQVCADFAEYACHNLTLSAGIVIAPPSYPIGQAAHEAEEAVEKSKAHLEKNRLTVLGRTLTWAQWKGVKKHWEELKDQDTSSAFLYSLLEYGKMWEEYKEGNVLGLRFQPLLAYNVSRNLDARKATKLYEWTKRLIEWKPGDKATESTLDNLSLLAQLLILSKGGSL